MTDDQTQQEIFARRLFNRGFATAIAIEAPLLGLGKASDAKLIELLHQQTNLLEAELHAGKRQGGFEPHAPAATAVQIAALAFAIVRNNGLLNRIDWPEEAERMA